MEAPLSNVSNNLKRHKCSGVPDEFRKNVGEIPTFDGAEFGIDKQKSKETLDKIERLICHLPPTVTDTKNSIARSVIGAGKQKSKETLDKLERSIRHYPPKVNGAKKSGDRSVIGEKWLETRVLQKPPENYMLECLKPKSLEELWVKNNTEDEEGGKTVKFLPTTTKELKERFNKLFCKFTRENKLEYRNELFWMKCCFENIFYL